MDGLGLAFSQIDAAFPLSLPEGATLGVEYILHTLRWAKLAGCPCIDTTDDRNCPAGATERDALNSMKRIYRHVVPIAEAYGIVINIEPHGYFTTKPACDTLFFGRRDGSPKQPQLRGRGRPRLRVSPAAR
jgi:inosose dehydratase